MSLSYVTGRNPVALATGMCCEIDEKARADGYLQDILRRIWCFAIGYPSALWLLPAASHEASIEIPRRFDPISTYACSYRPIFCIHDHQQFDNLLSSGSRLQ